MRFLALGFPPLDWNTELAEDILRVCGPEDAPDESVNGDPESMHGEDSEDGFDDMPLAVGWDDEGEEDDEDDGDETEDC